MTSKKLDQAIEKIENSKVLAEYREFILADWNEGDEHLKWVIDTPEDEILDWVEACQR